MKRFLLLAVVVCCCIRSGAADPGRSPGQPPPAAQDLVYFAESRPILLRLQVTVDGRPLPAAWDDFLGRVFKHLDANGDGVLDKSEAQRVPSGALLFGGAGGLDGSGDPSLRELAGSKGTITRDSLAGYFRRQSFGPFQLAAAGNLPHRRSAYYTFDNIVLNEVNFDILVEGDVRNLSAQSQTDSLNDNLFKLLDSNGDGKLSKEELSAAPTVLLKRDRNDDEIITPNELGVAQTDSIWLDGNVVTLFNLGDVRSVRDNPSPFRLVSAGESSLQLARTLQERYAGKDDKAKNKGLTRQQLGLDEAAFAGLDADGDGRLDLEELARFTRRTPDLELKVELGRKPTVSLVRRGTALEKQVRPGQGGTLILDLGGTRLDLKGLLAPKSDLAQSAKQLREQYRAAFKAADRDNNGYLDSNEARRSPFFGNTFKLLDRDGDGQLFEKEMLAYLEGFLQLQAQAKLCCANLNIAQQGKGLFEMLDSDGDGRLSVRELRNAPRLLADLDRDGDQALTRFEIPRCKQAEFRLGPVARAEVWIDPSVLAFSPDGAQLAAGRRARQFRHAVRSGSARWTAMATATSRAASSLAPMLSSAPSTATAMDSSASWRPKPTRRREADRARASEASGWNQGRAEGKGERRAESLVLPVQVAVRESSSSRCL